jgi:hypothetical protein
MDFRVPRAGLRYPQPKPRHPSCDRTDLENWRLTRIDSENRRNSAGNALAYGSFYQKIEKNIRTYISILSVLMQSYLKKTTRIIFHSLCKKGNKKGWRKGLL